jgi:hypothetical protein
MKIYIYYCMEWYAIVVFSGAIMFHYRRFFSWFRKEKVYSLLLPVLLTIGLSAQMATADILANWHERSAPYNTASYGNGYFVAASDSGTIVKSSDGLVWLVQPSTPSDYSIRKIVFGNNMFIAIGFYSSDFTKNVVLRSFDGTTWTESPIGTTGYLRDICYGDKTFVIVSDNGSILTSRDGDSWTIQLSKASYNIYGIAYGKDEFIAVAVENSASVVVLTSQDGISWTKTPSNIGSPVVAYGNGTFVAVGGAGLIMTSKDGVAWSTTTSGTTSDLYALTYTGNMFVAVGDNGIILTSADGFSWMLQPSGANNLLNGIAYGGNTLVAVGGAYYSAGRDQSIILSSEDNGATWITRASATTYDLYAAAHGKNTFVAVGEHGIMSSTDGAIWLRRLSSSQYYFDITYANNMFVAVGGGWAPLSFSPEIQTSQDGITWTSAAYPADVYSLYGVTYGNHTFVAVGMDGSIVTSPDGTTWTTSKPGRSGPTLEAIAYGNGMFVAVGEGGTIMTSPDGYAWALSKHGDAMLRHIAYGNKTFVVVADGGAVLTSADGLSWATISPFPHFINSIAFLNNMFIAGSSDGLLTSSDGNAWTVGGYAYTGPWEDITYGNGTFIAVGTVGTISQSDPTTSNCTATISDNLILHVPIIDYNNGAYYWADFSYAPNTLDFTLINAGVVPDIGPFSGCAFSTLSSDLKLHIPQVTFAGASYWADLQYTQDVAFTLTDAGGN